MTDGPCSRDGLRAESIESLAELAQALRQLRRRHARRRNDSVLTYRELSTRTGYAYGLIAEYFSGKVLPPTDRFDVLVQLLGANSVEQGALASARDRIEERRHARRPTRTKPQELPADVADFVGRGPELAALDSHLLPLDRRRTVPIAVVSGTGGVGKTALAGHWAHRAGQQFPDGCLYLDLHGYDQREPVASAEALATLLRRLDVLRMPHDLDERAALYRSTLAGRQLLLVLDNARDAAQVRPLLPGESGCAVLVTSRDTLAGLVARHGAHRIELGRLPVADAIDLLQTLLGTQEQLEPETMRILAERCARLSPPTSERSRLGESNPERGCPVGSFAAAGPVVEAAAG
jgi:AAA ATPase domain